MRLHLGSHELSRQTHTVAAGISFYAVLKQDGYLKFLSVSTQSGYRDQNIWDLELINLNLTLEAETVVFFSHHRPI
jgi:hypothetical protein